MVSFFLSNEEMGKKDDDHKPTKIPPIRPSYWNARVPPRKTLRRLAIAIVSCFLVYLFIANIPTDVPIRDRRRPVYIYPDSTTTGDSSASRNKPEAKISLPVLQSHPKGAAQAHEAESVIPSAYDGPVKFLELGETLQGISGTRGAFAVNRNILFAAANLQSAATLLPIACQMGAELRSYVHFALLGGTDIPLGELRSINGIDDSCEILYHDGRPDFASSSSESRLKHSVVRAIFHINNYMQPQAILIDTENEEQYLLGGARSQTLALHIPLIELPAESGKRLTWMTKLDSASLAAWNKVTIDILIQASSGASGSLIRLLKSLSAADFTACAIPHLTIELPHDIDRPTAQFLENFHWPPPHVRNPSNVRQLTLRHRIPTSRITEEESSVRFLESFWPADPKNSHVLILSPQTELAPGFYHYLKYAVLEYTHSSTAKEQDWTARLLGISLDLPSIHLNASAPFIPPSKKDAVQSSVDRGDGPTSFLWQAPDSNAVLFLGTKWVELHSVVSESIDAKHRCAELPRVLREKSVSKRYPAWLEHALRLCRIRGLWTLYPSPITASNLATVHNDLWQPPEEHDLSDLTKDETEVTEITMAVGPLLDSLPGGGILSTFIDMPLLRWDGGSTSLVEIDQTAKAYAAEYERAVRSCQE